MIRGAWLGPPSPPRNQNKKPIQAARARGDVRLRYGAGSRLCCKDDLDKSINVTPRCQTMSPRIIHLPLSGRDRRHYVRELRDRLFEILWRLRPGGYLLRCFVNIRMT
jgi:hypothetical protein